MQRKTKEIDLYRHSLFIVVSQNEQCRFQQPDTCGGSSPTTVLVLVVFWSIRPLTLFEPAITMGVAGNAEPARYLYLHDAFLHGSCFVSLLFLLKGKVQFSLSYQHHFLLEGEGKLWINGRMAYLSHCCELSLQNNLREEALILEYCFKGIQSTTTGRHGNMRVSEGQLVKAYLQLQSRVQIEHRTRLQSRLTRNNLHNINQQGNRS